MKIDITFKTCDLDYTSEEIVKNILYALVQNIRHHERNFLVDFDDETLHQFRVNIRKTLSLIKFFKPFFEQDQLYKSETFLKSTFKSTNRKRDLDVYIAALNDYQKSLDKHDKKKIKELKKDIELKISDENEAISGMLTSEEYQKRVLDYQVFILRAQSIQSDFTSMPIEVVFEQLIHDKLASINYRISAIDGSSPIKMFHKLRIEFKEFRYLIEAYYDTFKLEDIKEFIKRLKEIQDIFGELQDVDTQLKNLKHFIRENDTLDLSSFKKLRKYNRNRRKDIKMTLLHELKDNIDHIECQIRYIPGTPLSELDITL